ncbi:phosphoglucomutase [Kutzneria buriramensis]|uniref:Phosphomannomutase n=1 Tax=Kutzneria buriramensis TaxID=1045776 RepID=A0A3E0G5R0_9PSEU|nr:phosphoglucomutase [Kutzneria buriramensis]REH18142.1 phosphomannomutase [Kutzneria buriramensis]
MRLRSSADGWRGIIGQGFTPVSAGELAGRIVAVSGGKQVLVGYDGRRYGAAAGEVVARSAAAAGAAEVRLVPHLPTPTATAAVRLGHADLAVLVTASHNPASWNGVKIKLSPGCPPVADLERAIDAAPVWSGALDGIAVDAMDADELVSAHVADVLGKLPSIPRRPLRVVLDGLGGIASGTVVRLCGRLNWAVDRIGSWPDPDFGGLTPDPALPASRRRACERVLATGADLGVVLDGDGDRVFLIDGRGRTVQPAELLGLLLEHRHRRTGRAGTGVAVTVATGTAVRRVASWLGMPVIELGVGFKHLSPMLASGRVDAAGGGVGDLCFVEHGLDRDPLAALALVAELLQDTGLGLAELVDDLRHRVGGLHPFESRVDGGSDPGPLQRIGLESLRDNGLVESVEEITDIDGIKFWLPGGQWLLLRPSSTEGGVRVYGELAVPVVADAVVAAVETRLQRQ